MSNQRYSPESKREAFKPLTWVTTLLFLTVGLSGCVLTQPPCPSLLKTAPAASAGCVVVNQNQLLVVEGMNGKVSVPGGSSDDGETPQCTAHRETWEETGLDVRPLELVRVFQNGFHLFNCQLHQQSGDINPPMRLEIKRAFWLAPDNFQQHQWRFPGQEKWLAEWIKNNP